VIALMGDFNGLGVAFRHKPVTASRLARAFPDATKGPARAPFRFRALRLSQVFLRNTLRVDRRLCGSERKLDGVRATIEREQPVEDFIVSHTLREVRLKESSRVSSHEFDSGPGDGVYFPTTSPHMTHTTTDWATPGDGGLRTTHYN
jgi:hypothetical protein